MKNASPQQRILLGAFILIIGVLSLVDNLNIFNTRSLLQFWPTVFIVLGALKIVQAKNNSGYLIGGTLITAGIVMTLNRLGFISFNMRDFWPVFLIIGGLLIIFKDRIKNTREMTDSNVLSSLGSDSKIDVVAVMSGNQGKISSPDFRGGEITAIMGGVELDLRAASIETEAVLNVFAVWGGIVLKVPNDWTIINNGIAIMGGIDDKSVPAMNSGKRLIITGYAIMGGVEIKN
ncbi:MAG: DUF5668 domain-containing protein [Undibacterium sp.]|nr:DUF5668 domain-containing protein [Undibacterium sp.]